MLTPEEKFIIQEIHKRHNSLDLKTALNLFKATFTLSLDDFKTYRNGQPKWLYNLRKSHHSLKDKGLIGGNEFGTWFLTQTGRELVSSIIYEDKNALLQFHEELPLYDADPPPSVVSTVYRKVRDTRLSANLKNKYENFCQICKTRTSLGHNMFYSEGHHMKPLGLPHEGPDIEANIIVLCPCHHVQFDYASIAINPESLLLEHLDENDSYNGAPLLLQRHVIGINFIEYHYQLFLTKKQV